MWIIFHALTYYGLVMAYIDVDLGHHWLRHRYSVRYFCLMAQTLFLNQMLTFDQWGPLVFTTEQFLNEWPSYYAFKITATSPRGQWVNWYFKLAFSVKEIVYVWIFLYINVFSQFYRQASGYCHSQHHRSVRPTVWLMTSMFLSCRPHFIYITHFWSSFLSEASFGLWVLSVPVSVCVSSVRASTMNLFVR